MHPLAILGISSFLVALLLTPLFRNFLRSVGLVDQPDNVRKLHTSPIPNMGGVPIAVAYMASFGVLRWFGPNLTGTNLAAGIVDSSLALKLFAASSIILVLGVIDDWIPLRPVHKIAVQIVAAMVVYSSGVQITGLQGYHLPQVISVLATILWLLACTNAFNLIDGIDGLAAGVGLFATATTMIAALLQHNIALAAATIPLLGALIGFLRYNFNPATIFLGDSGSCLIGFLLGCFGIMWSQKSATILGMTAPLMALSVPIMDAGLSIVRRFLRHQPIMSGDRGHIHHRLLARGFSQRKVVLLLYGTAGIAAGFSLLQGFTANHYAGAIILMFCAVAWLGVQNLGYAEFGQARQMILNGGFRRALNSQLELATFRAALDAAQSPDEAWALLGKTARTFGFLDVCWKSGDRLYRDKNGQPCGAVWTIRIPLDGSDYVECTRGPNDELLAVNISLFADAVRAGLTRPELQSTTPLGQEATAS